jgi:DNA-binding transcriptional ArsR family regulator
MAFFIPGISIIIIFKGLNMIENSSVELQPYSTQAELYKVLAHPARLAILNILRDGEHCVCHMEAHLGFRQSYLSQQLSVLREAGLIQDRRDGWNIFYRVVDPQIYNVLDSAQRLSGEEYPQAVKTGIVCTCPHCTAKASGD